MASFLNKNSQWLTIIFLLLSLIGYIILGYHVERSDFFSLITIYSFIFLAYLLLYHLNFDNKHINLLLGGAILFRLALLFMLPNFSDDYFRFIWDGRLLNNGLNPFTILPSTFIESNVVQLQSVNQGNLFKHLNSPDYFTLYPPISQFVYYIGAKLSPDNVKGSVIIMRLFILIADIGNIILLSKLLKYFRVNTKNIILYALNPLIILELTGNLHFEGIMLFFLLLAVYLFIKGFWDYAAIAFSFSIATKLIPLMFLPFLWKRLLKKQLVLVYLIIGLSLYVFFAVFIDASFINNISSSLDLYFQKFEFNASVFYIIRWLGFLFHGHDIIQVAGPILALLTFSSIMYLAYAEKQLGWKHFIEMVFIANAIYLLFTATVHPWYLTILIATSIFTNYRFVILWSLMIMLSYATYQTNNYIENLYLVGFEYIVVSGYLIYEVFVLKRLQAISK